MRVVDLQEFAELFDEAPHVGETLDLAQTLFLVEIDGLEAAYVRAVTGGHQPEYVHAVDRTVHERLYDRLVDVGGRARAELFVRGVEFARFYVGAAVAVRIYEHYDCLERQKIVFI